MVHQPQINRFHARNINLNTSDLWLSPSFCSTRQFNVPLLPTTTVHVIGLAFVHTPSPKSMPNLISHLFIIDNNNMLYLRRETEIAVLHMHHPCHKKREWLVSLSARNPPIQSRESMNAVAIQQRREQQKHSSNQAMGKLKAYMLLQCRPYRQVAVVLLVTPENVAAGYYDTATTVESLHEACRCHPNLASPCQVSPPPPTSLCAS